MSNISINTGRTKQKQRTRRKILDITKELLQQGKKLSLEVVAEASGISRATIYRYFSNIDILCSEAGLDIFTNSTTTIFQETKDLPIIERILYIQNYFNDLALDNEPGFRKYLSIYLKEDVSNKKESPRGSRRTAALKLALVPYRNKLDSHTYNNLISTATSLMGIESIICTKDVCNLTNRESKEALAWGLKIILKSVF
ncbi:TetR/AcrR family transcriptional regulator [Flavisericum labens]|uniref:TetR/AcrR family transcriptional regulator n=1 Tax=Flavisericum labens TaxID=3377112 RepID=UPI00387B5A67